MLRNATWTLSNFCRCVDDYGCRSFHQDIHLDFSRGKPQPPFDLVKPALPTLAGLIYSNDEEVCDVLYCIDKIVSCLLMECTFQVLTDACWALSYLSDGTNEKIQAVIDAG
jgi:importin subunit alpha-6/7